MSEHPTPKDGVPAFGAEGFGRIHMQDLARELFDAYSNEGPSPWKTPDGRDAPRWLALGDQERGKWLAVALCAVERL